MSWQMLPLYPSSSMVFVVSKLILSSPFLRFASLSSGLREKGRMKTIFVNFFDRQKLFDRSEIKWVGGNISFFMLFESIAFHIFLFIEKFITAANLNFEKKWIINYRRLGLENERKSAKLSLHTVAQCTALLTALPLICFMLTPLLLDPWIYHNNSPLRFVFLRSVLFL